MKTFKHKLDDIINEATNTLRDLINSKGVESDHNNRKCLRVTKEDHQHNLSDDRYLTEINAECLVDNNGYEYNYYVLDTEDFLSTIDYLITKYKYR